MAGAASAAVLVLAACSSGGGGGSISGPSARPPVVDGVLGFDRDTAVDHDTQGTGTFRTASPVFSCGSATDTYAADLITNGPGKAHVRYEWGDVAPGLQAYAAGTVNGVAFSSADLPFTHPFGPDVTFEMGLDKPYADLAQVVGKGLSGIPPGALHTEIAQGLVPHGPDGDYLAGFTPAEGEWAAAYGPWVIDCGHDDFHTEIHPPTMLALAHVDGSTTVSNAFANPYIVTQLFNPDPATAADLADTKRLEAPTTVIFPNYVVNLILGMLGQGSPAFQGMDRLESHTLIDVNRFAGDITWYVCAPGTQPSGGTLDVTSNFTTRQGIDVTVTPRDEIGCAEVTASMGPSYTAAPLQRKDCELDWDQLNMQAGLALMRPDLDIRKAIKDLVPKSIAPKIERNPVVDCYDPLEAPPVGTSGKAVVDDGQPFPFYGSVEVSWK